MPEKSLRGFASMDPERRRAIAAMGGRAAQQKGTGHVWSAREAREAGRKGGATVGKDRDHMSLIGKQGGRIRREAAAEQRRLQRERLRAAERTPPLLEQQRMA